MSWAPACTALGLGLVVAASAGADPEIEDKIAVLRSLIVAANPAAAPAPARPSSRCSAARARRLDPAKLVVTKLRAIHDASLRYAVSSDLIRSVIRHESAGNPAAVSRKGAMGLMQLMPATARALGVTCAFDTRQNVMGGALYLRQLRDRLGTWRLAIAAYHAGAARAESGRLPLETRRYVERVLRTWRRG